ncbi:MAG: hypothetical protein NT128_01050 [Proteobacteria bacterium]|nr:hypothetical protein [Pseudomonadota bacterium]
MKKVLVLTACLLSGLTAASVSGEKKINEAEIQRVTTEMERVTGEIAGNQGMIDRAKSDKEFEKFLISKNPRNLELRKEKVDDFKKQLKALEDELQKLLH